MKPVPTGAIQFKRFPDNRSFHRIKLLHLAFPAIKVPHGRGDRIQALLQPPIKSFPRLFSQVPDEVRGDDRLDVR